MADHGDPVQVELILDVVQSLDGALQDARVGNVELEALVLQHLRMEILDFIGNLRICVIG